MNEEKVRPVAPHAFPLSSRPRPADGESGPATRVRYRHCRRALDVAGARLEQRELHSALEALSKRDDLVRGADTLFNGSRTSGAASRFTFSRTYWPRLASSRSPSARVPSLPARGRA
jgi:hypothetical protein